jgi:4'-phosphopantetheinyl transferase
MSPVPQLEPGHVHVWTLAPGPRIDEPLWVHRVAELPPSERARWERLRLPHKKNEYLFGKLLTRRLLAEYTGRPARALRFREAGRGKPVLIDGGDLRFNLSHTGGLLALAVTRGAEVGVDVEEVEPRDPGVAERFFAMEEAAQVRACSPAEKERLFARFWTLKEAYIKVHGEGLAIPLASFRFELGDPVRISFRDPDGGDPAAWWFAWRDPSPRHALAVAVHAHGPMSVRWLSINLTDL